MLTIEGLLESAPIVAVLAPVPEADVVLTGRGFHWINEFPFNR